DARHLAPAEPTGAANADALGAEFHRGGDGLLHGAPESDAPLELGRDVLCDELGVGFGLPNLLHVDEDFVAVEQRNAGEHSLALRGGADVAAFQDLDPLAAFADHHAWARGVDDDLGAVRGALDFDAGDVRVVEVLLDGALDADVLMEPLLVARAVLVPL